jgi:hypothetical protein
MSIAAFQDGRKPRSIEVGKGEEKKFCSISRK